MGGYRVTEQAKQLIVNTWASLKNQGKNPSAKEVLAAAQANISVKRGEIFLPRIRTVQNILSEAIERAKKLPINEEIQQRQWSMSALSDYPLPSESIPFVLQVWRYCLHTEERFTIRQAKWISRICSVHPWDITHLWMMSYIYSKKEELSLFSKIPLDTFLDDKTIVLAEDLEIQTYLEAHRGTNSMIDIYGLGLALHENYEPMEEFMHPIDYYQGMIDKTVTNERDIKLVNLLLPMPSLTSLHLGTELKLIYLSWYTNIRKKPEWSKISAKQALEIIKELRKWVLNLKTSLKIGHSTSLKFEPAGKGHLLTYTGFLPKPEQALKLLSEFANKETKS